MAEEGEAPLSSECVIIFDFFCELCIDDNKQVEAEAYCVDCREYLCGYCCRGHRTTRASRHHVLQDKVNMPKNTPLSCDRVSKDIVTKCKVHGSETVKFYCKSHDALGCSKCFTTAHRGCPDVESIEYISENILASQDYKDFMANLQSIQKKSIDTVTRSRDNKTVSVKCCADVVSSVRQLKEEAIVVLNEIEKNIVTLAEQIKSEDEGRMESVEADCNVMSEKIEQLFSEFESLKCSKLVCQLYIKMREAESEVRSFRDCLSRIEVTNVVRTSTFEPNVELLSFLRSQHVLGKVSVHGQSARQTSQATSIVPSNMKALHVADVGVRAKVSVNDLEVKENIQGNTTDSRNVTASHVAEIDVCSRSDKRRCCITGSSVVSNNILIIADRENDKVKLVGTQTNVIIGELTTFPHPDTYTTWDVTVISRDQAAVTLPRTKKILLIRMADKLTAEREIPVGGNCYGVAYNKDRLLVTFGGDPRLEIIDLHGKIIRRIESGVDGNKLFTRPLYVCVSKDGDTIYVSDISRGTVTSVAFDGVVKTVYTDEQLSGPTKMCLDHHGNVFVCGRDSRNVHMLTADCKKMKVILTQADGLNSKVYSVSHCQDTNRLFIGITGNKVKVYQLS